MSSRTLLALFSLSYLSLSVALARPAADIAKEKAGVDGALKQAPAAAPATAPGARPVPGVMGGGGFSPVAEGDHPFSLLGVVSGTVGGSQGFYDTRDKLWQARQSLQPKIDEQQKLKKGYAAEIDKLDAQVGALRRQEDEALSKAANEEARTGIKETFENRIADVIDKQDDWTKKKNEADQAIQKILQDPDLRAAQQQFQVETDKDIRRYASGGAQ